MTALMVENIGKAYRVYTSQWHRIARWFGLKIKPREENWVLRHVGFNVMAGEAIGIVGQNGAGKSTLLKIITGTLHPSEGAVRIGGRVAAILELGMGFNHELTGRQNVYHSAGLMGFSPEQADAAMPEIEAFAEIGHYFDEPVRTYSSGMSMRVAFAVATAWRPEVLILDEVLSVGDAYFQHKSIGRIREFKEKGTTLLIVSHDRNAILTLCDRAVLLEKGMAIKSGAPEEVFDFYNAIIAEKEESTIQIKEVENQKIQTSSGTGEAKVEDISLYNSAGERVDYVTVGEQVKICIKVKVFQEIETLVLGYCIKDHLGQFMYGTNTWHTDQVITMPKVGDEFKFTILFMANLGVGSYSVQTALVDRDTHLTANYEWRDMALIFNVVNKDKPHFIGCLWSEPKIEIEGVVS